MGRAPVRLAAAEQVLDRWAVTPPESVTLSQQEAAAGVGGDRDERLDCAGAYGGLNPAIKRSCVLDAACAGSRRSKATITTGRTLRSTRVPEWIPTGRGVGEAA